jgi:hypothetical protein
MLTVRKPSKLLALIAQHRHHDRREERRYDDRNRCHNDRDRRHDERDHRTDDRKHRRNDRPESSRGRLNRRRRPDSSVNAVNTPHAKHTYDVDYAKLLDGPCPIHKGAKHTMGECKGLNRAFRVEDAKRSWCNDDEIDDGQGGGREKDAGPAYQDATKTITSIFGGRATSEDKREQKLTA